MLVLRGVSPSYWHVGVFACLIDAIVLCLKRWLRQRGEVSSAPKKMDLSKPPPGPRNAVFLLLLVKQGYRYVSCHEDFAKAGAERLYSLSLRRSAVQAR